MLDLCGRSIDYLRLSVTDLCNYRCQYCMPADGVAKRPHTDMLSIEELVKISEACIANGVKKIRLTGREPLVRRGIVELCQKLRALPGLDELCITTNGALLPQLAQPLRDAGVDRLNISMDTLRPDRFASITRLGTLEAVTRGIEAAQKAGFDRLKFDAVLIGGFNDDEIGDFLELTRTHPWEIRFIELMAMGPCATWDKSCFISADTVLERYPALQQIESQGVARRYRLPGAVGTIGLISPVSHEFCSQCSRIRVTADGKLKGCLHAREEIPLRGLEGDALREAICQGILQKPLRHHLSERPSDTPRNMNEIGG